MKGAVIAIDRNARLTRAALLIDGVLDGIEIDRHGETLPQSGAVYRCRITETIPALGAAFADLGAGQSGFFPDAQGLSAGQSILAEVRREPEGDKAARLTRDIQHRGRSLVFTPTRPGINVSRKITDVTIRSRLTDALAPLAEEGGFVLRTAAAALSSEALLSEAQALVARHTDMTAQGTPSLLQPAPDAATRLIDAAPAGTPILATRGAVEAIAPLRNVATVEDDPFDTLDIDACIADLLAPRVALGEGWLSIDATPALVAIDVNTGGARSGDALMRVNLDAAARLPGLLALRRLGGIVMVDFAGAPKGTARKRIEPVIARAARVRLDHVRPLGWGPAGLYELACARPGRSLADLLKDDAP